MANLLFHLLFVTLCSSFVRCVHADDSDFIDEKGKALKNLKVIPGSKRDKIDYHTVEQEAGQAVLKLLDAKIGRKVNDAAKEVTDFLNDAVGHHAKQRAEKIQADKEKEMSLLHLGAKKILSSNDEEEKPKKNKDGSFLVHFKIPYIVTPVDSKKPKAKKFHPKKVKHHHHHLKKYHHRVHKHHHHHHHPPALDANKPAAPAPQATYTPQDAPAIQPQAPPPSYNAIDMTFNGYNWTYKFTNDSSSDMVPCQGSCMGPCTTECSLSQDCCCCDPNLMTQNPIAPVPAYPPAEPPPSPLPLPPPPSPPMYQPPVIPSALPPPVCPVGCTRNCFTYCPRDCCGVAGKRDKVLSNEESGSKETADQPENDQKDNGSASGVVKQSEEEKHDTSAKSAEDNGKHREQNTSDFSQEGSSDSDKVEIIENDD